MARIIFSGGTILVRDAATFAHLPAHTLYTRAQPIFNLGDNDNATTNRASVTSKNMRNSKTSVSEWSSHTKNIHTAIINNFLPWKHGQVVAKVLSCAQLFYGTYPLALAMCAILSNPELRAKHCWGGYSSLDFGASWPPAQASKS